MRRLGAFWGMPLGAKNFCLQPCSLRLCLHSGTLPLAWLSVLSAAPPATKALVFGASARQEVLYSGLFQSYGAWGAP